MNIKQRAVSGEQQMNKDQQNIFLLLTAYCSLLTAY
jgi:hypothetical protein